MPDLKAPSGVQWHYEIEGSGEALIFFHGWGCNSRVWVQQVKHFSQTHQVITLDLPGHGQSSFQETGISEMARDVLFIAGSLGVKNVHGVASSLGGLIAIAMSSSRQEFFKSLTMVGSLPRFARGKDYPYGLEVERIDKLRQQLKSDYPAIVPIFFRSLFTRQERESERFKWLGKFRAQDSVPLKTALETCLNFVEKEDRRVEFGKLKMPLCFLNGTEDYICPVNSVEYLVSVHPEARVELFKDCGHFPFVSRPEKFNQVLNEFLNDVGSRVEGKSF